LNDSLKKEGGHIGYGVAPMYRKKGYATKMLSLALKKANDLGINRALVTCSRSNIASAKVVQNNNGFLDSEELYNGNIIQRYWIDIKFCDSA